MANVRIYTAGASLWVEGDTYQIRELLKNHRFRWSPDNVAWHRTFSGFATLPDLVKTLLNQEYTVTLASNLQRIVCPAHGLALEDQLCPECEKTDAIIGADMAEAKAMNTSQQILENDDYFEQPPWNGNRNDDPDAPTVTQPGVYQLPNGDIFVVKPNRAKTRLYAKRLVEVPSERLTEAGGHVDFDFEYDRGAIYHILPEHQMALNKAKELMIRYGKCIVCSRRLKVAKSVERGIGPICAKYFKEDN